MPKKMKITLLEKLLKKMGGVDNAHMRLSTKKETDLYYIPNYRS